MDDDINVMWKFKTKQFKIVATIEPDDYEEDDAETSRAIANGLWQCFSTRVVAYLKTELPGRVPSGIEIGSDSLGQCMNDRPSFSRAIARPTFIIGTRSPQKRLV